ncbi:MAG TPA: AAA family ATPase, partial [Planctomycetota bacterium]|nr:AAA family ATPase [Planctomycetota bacterium]
LAESKLVVVVGGNEGGKSTFLEYLTTMLFGFAPANREQNPYSPWSGESLSGAIALLLRDGTAVAIGRQLRHLPEARLQVGETEKSIGNAPLPTLGPITREIWRSFHALTPDELNEMDEAAWTAVEERLLGGCHLEFLRAVREAASELDGRAAALWQSHGKGHAQHRRLALALRRLRRERDQAVARACRLSELRELVAGRHWHIQIAEEQLIDLRSRLDRAETLLPVLRGIQQMDELRRKYAERLPQDDLPDDAQGQLSLLRSTVAEHDRTAAEVVTRRLELEQRSQIPAEDEALLAVEADVRALVSEAAVHHQDVVHLNDIVRECDAQEALFRERAASLFGSPPDAKGREALSRIGMADLQARIKTWEDSRRLPEEAQADVVRAQEAVKIAQADFEVLPSVDAERKLRQREEALRQLQSREDLLVAIQNDIKAAKAQATMAAGNIKAPGAKLGDAVLKGAGLVGAGLTVAATLIMGGSSWHWVLGPVALGLVGAGARTLKNRKSSGPRMPDEVRADALARECLKLRADLELHEYETFVGHLERSQQALALVAQRPELERRLIAARQRLEECKRRVNDRKEELRLGASRVTEALEGLPILSGRLANPGTDLITDLNELRNVQRQLTRLQGERSAVAARAQERETRAGQLAEKLGLSGSGSPMESIPLWHDRLQRALSVRRRAEEARHLLPATVEAAEQAVAGQKQARESLEA